MVVQTQRVGQRRYRAKLLVAGVIACAASAACGVTDGELPPDVKDPATVQTQSGAMGFYRGVVTTVLPVTFDQVIDVVGIITDEVTATPVPVSQIGTATSTDSRAPLSMASRGLVGYRESHRLRAQAREARAFLKAYASDSMGMALRGHLYALEGYADVFLADNFCSGIPLSRVDFGADYTLAAGSSTAEVYNHALELFDSALVLTIDSIRFQHLATVGRGRTLLALGRYADATASVATVPDAFSYDVVPPTARWVAAFDPSSAGSGLYTVASGEGSNGLNYRGSGDPRTATVSRGLDIYGNARFAPAKYIPLNGGFRYVLASGIEARLIEAEAALQAGDVPTWLEKLNHLRRTATSMIRNYNTAGQLQPPPPAFADTTDPGTPEARVNLLFRERAFWLYLTGVRQGDMRRLVRDYGRWPETVYPTGTYPGGNGLYGEQIVLSVPDEERQLNTKYAGCIHLDA